MMLTKKMVTKDAMSFVFLLPNPLIRVRLASVRLACKNYTKLNMYFKSILKNKEKQEKKVIKMLMLLGSCYAFVIYGLLIGHRLVIETGCH